MRPLPRMPTGTSDEAKFVQWVHRCVDALQRGNVAGFLALLNVKPPRPTGIGYEAQLMQYFYDWILRHQPKETRGVLIQKTGGGVSHRAAQLPQPPRGDNQVAEDDEET
jgi:hypothetical protein